MANEVVFIHVGQCGLQLGLRFWERVCEEHGIEPSGRSRGAADAPLTHLGALFREEAGRYLPRAVWVDLDPAAMDSFGSSPLGALCKPQDRVSGEAGAEKSWAQGHHGLGPQVLDRVMTAVEAQVGHSASLQGFVVVHALGGGTGSGLGSLLLRKLREQYPDKIVATFSVLPSLVASPDASNHPAEPVNAALSLDALSTHADMCFLIDNLALHHLRVRLRRSEPGAAHNLDEMNHIAVAAMAGVAAAWSWPGGLSMRRMAVALNPLPRTNLHIVGMDPIVPKGSSMNRELSEGSLITNMFDRRSMMMAVDPRHGLFLASLGLLRGAVSAAEAHVQMQRFTEKQALHVGWIADNKPLHILPAPHGAAARSAILVGTSSVVCEVLGSLAGSVRLAMRQKGAATLLAGAGVAASALDEASQLLADLTEHYRSLTDDRSEEPDALAWSDTPEHDET
jgi:tubulin beta